MDSPLRDCGISHSASASATNVTYKDDDAKAEIEKGEPSLKSAFESTKEISSATEQDIQSLPNVSELGDFFANVIGAAITASQETREAESLEDNIRKSIKSADTRYRELYLALLRSEWEKAKDLIEPEALTSIISKNSESIFHIIVGSTEDGAIRLLQECLNVLPGSIESVLEKEDVLGYTALARAALVGNIKAVELLVERNKNLVSKRDKEELLPIHNAALNGHKEMFKYLLSETKNSNGDLNLFAGKSGFLLVGILIETNLYDIAFDLLTEHPNLARDELKWWSRILEMLATKPMGFKSGSRLGYWQRLIYRYIPVQEECIHQKQKNDAENPTQKSQNSSTKSSPFRVFGAWSQKLNIMFWKILLRQARSIQSIHDKKLMHIHSVEIVKMMCAGVDCSSEEAMGLQKPLHTATRLGILEIVQEIIKVYPYSLSFVDEDGNNAYMLAVLHRQEKIFKFISQTGVMKQSNVRAMNHKDGNSILHLAAKSVPLSEIPGAALQMQRELQWFKAVENYVHPILYEQRNDLSETPRELFTKEHKKLIEKGEQWMRNNATSCTIAISLIITAVFAAAFTVPGGIDDKGIPNFLHKLAFKIFVMSDGLALFSSTTSLLIFIGILTASYSEEEFLISLPRKLIIGFITMFVSIASMMVAFGATIYMVFSDPWKWVIIPLGCVPVTIFARLQFPLLLRIYYSTYAPTISQPLKNM